MKLPVMTIYWPMLNMQRQSNQVHITMMRVTSANTVQSMAIWFLPPELEIKEILDRIQVRLVAFQKAFRHVYFVLQRLFLLPQGRAPPLFA